VLGWFLCASSCASQTLPVRATGRASGFLGALPLRIEIDVEHARGLILTQRLRGLNRPATERATPLHAQWPYPPRLSRRYYE
jgi:hypothetical protein